MRNSSRDKISPPINIKFQFPWGEKRRRNCSKLFKFEIRVCVTLPSLYYSRPPYYVEIRCFPTVYEIGEPWPLVITSRHHSGKEYFRGSISKFAATNIQNLGPIISRPFEVSDPRPQFRASGEYSARESCPPLLCTKFGEQTPVRFEKLACF